MLQKIIVLMILTSLLGERISLLTDIRTRVWQHIISQVLLLPLNENVKGVSWIPVYHK